MSTDMIIKTGHFQLLVSRC